MIKFYLSDYISRIGYAFVTVACASRGNGNYRSEAYSFILDSQLLKLKEERRENINVDMGNLYSESANISMALRFSLDTIKGSLNNYVQNFYLVTKELEVIPPNVNLGEIDENDVLRNYLFHQAFVEPIKLLNQETNLTELQNFTQKLIDLDRPQIEGI